MEFFEDLSWMSGKESNLKDSKEDIFPTFTFHSYFVYDIAT